MDPVIHSTLQAVMKELSRDRPLQGPSRVRVLDLKPMTLTLRMLAESGRGTANDNRYFEVGDLAATVLGLYVLLVRNRLDEYARSNVRKLPLPRQRDELLRRISITAPAMLRWTWSILGNTQGATGLRGLVERRDDYYVPLATDPERTLIAFDVREELATRYGVSPDADAPDDVGAFLAISRVGRAFMPVGLRRHEVDKLDNGADLTHLPVQLKSPLGRLDRIVVARDEGGLRGFSLETGSEVVI